jgi:DNA-binding NarL/FixJ family response regulator
MSGSKSISGVRNSRHRGQPRFCQARCGGGPCPLDEHSQTQKTDGNPGFLVPEPSASRAPMGEPLPAIKMALVDDDPEVHQMVNRISDECNGLHSCAQFSTGLDALRAIPKLDVQVVLIEIALPDFCGIFCACQLCRRRPDLKAIITSALRHHTLLSHARGAGLHGYLRKPFSPCRCLATLRVVCEGRVLPSALRPEEDELLRCLADGLSYKQAQERLLLSEAGLKKLQHRTFQHFEASCAVEAVRKWRALTADPA